jgi:[ribosomal protein S5]-alanine N-acetyltransferase
MEKFISKELNGFLPLFSERIILRNIKKEELSVIQDIVCYDQVIAGSLEDAENLFDLLMDDCRKGESIHLGIALKNSDKLIGTIGFYRGFAGNKGEIGYIIKNDFRGKGYMTDAVEEILKFGFEILSLDEIFANTEPDNAGSYKVLIKNGLNQVESDNPDYIKFSIQSEEYLKRKNSSSVNLN